MKEYKINIFIILVCFFVSSCSAAKKAFDPNANAGDEFLVEKKSPLAMPPNYNELPLPDFVKEKNEEEKKIIEMLITKSKKSSDKESKRRPITSFEVSIIDKISKN